MLYSACCSSCEYFFYCLGETLIRYFFNAPNKKLEEPAEKLAVAKLSRVYFLCL